METYTPNQQGTTPVQEVQQQEPEQSSFDVKELFYICISHWKWFVISLVAMFTIVTFKLLRTLPTYTRQATVLIKEDTRQRGIRSDISATFNDMAMFSSNANVMDELKSFQSPATMMEVVKRLGLDREYSIDGSFHRNPIYGRNLPITVSFENIQDRDNLQLSIQLKGDGTYIVTDFAKNGEQIEGEYVGAVNQRVKTPIGIIAVYPTAHYNRAYDEKILISRHSFYSTTNHYLSKLSAELGDKQGATIDLKYLDVSTDRAEDVLNMLITVYNEMWVKDKNQIAISTSNFINERLAVIEKDLGTVDNDISSYKSEHLLPDVQAASQMYMQQADKAGQDEMKLNNQLYMARYIKKYLCNDANKYQLLPANSGIEATGIESQISDYNKILLQRNSLVANSSEANPIVADLDAGLKTMRSAIIHSISNVVTTLSSQLSSLQQYSGEATQQISSNPKQAKYLLSVERQQKVKENLYLYLLQKREENQLSQAFTAYNTRVITPPYGSNAPTSPVRSNYYLIALALGLIIPIAILYVRNSMNTTVRGRKDVEKALSIPFLGEIPQSGHKKKKWWQFTKKEEKKIPRLVVKPGSRNMMNEAYRVLRTNLEFMIGDGAKCEVIVTTSYNPGSGKTFTVINLATSLAIKKKKVLLVDGDLRRGSLSDFFGNPKLGLSDFLANKVADISQVITPSKKQETLDLIPRGTVPPNPTELLFNPNFAAMIEDMKKQYDYIFIDCPPVDIVADTPILEKLADRTLFIVRAGLLERAMLPELEKDYKENRFKNMGLILNGTPNGGNSRYGYHYSYGYHYGKHSYGYYGYGSSYGGYRDKDDDE